MFTICFPSTICDVGTEFDPALPLSLNADARSILIPARAKPLLMLKIPSNTTRTPANLRKCRWNAPLAKLDMALREINAGNVPKENTNIVNAPTFQSPLARDRKSVVEGERGGR